MNARTFGKKGATEGEAVIASRRAAFLAQERARAGGESRGADTEVFPSGETTIAHRVEFIEKPKRVREPVGPRSLPLTWVLWMPLGLAGAHRLYLGRYITGGIQAAFFVACVVAVFGFQIYPAFAGLAVCWIAMFVDGLRLKTMYAEAVGTPAGATRIDL